MPQSLACVYIHAVLSTRDRMPFLSDPGLRSEVHAYLGGITKKLECPVLAVGGVEDHVHMLVRMSRTLSIANWIKEVKRVSSIFAKERVNGFAWQAGYGAFSVDPTSLERVRMYIAGQEEHHGRVSFQDEFRRLLAGHGMEWDERYVWD
jgi:REP element-mobilizing transposase RayT